MILTYILFLSAALISIYSSDLRRFLTVLFTVPPQKLRAGWKASRLLAYETTLSHLKKRHNNAYELVLYALTEIGGMAIFAVLIGIIGLFLVTALQGKLTGEQSSLVITTYFAAGPFMIAVSFVKVFVEFRHLKHYDQRVVYLEKKIAELTQDERSLSSSK
jgi:hypothetical protein